MLALILAFLLAPTAHANARAAALLGARETACDAPLWRQPYGCAERVEAALRHVSDRESPGSYGDGYWWVGRHAGDSQYDARVRRKAQRRARLASPWWCPWSAPEGSSTVGPHGLMRAYHAHRVGGCLPWQAFGLSSVSSIAAASWYLEHCGEPGDVYRPDLVGWCPGLIDQMQARRRRQQRGLL